MYNTHPSHTQYATVPLPSPPPPPSHLPPESSTKSSKPTTCPHRSAPLSWEVLTLGEWCGRGQLGRQADWLLPSVTSPPNMLTREAMAEDKRLDLLSFTGSCQVGREVGVTVQRRFGEPQGEGAGTCQPLTPPSHYLCRQ